MPKQFADETDVGGDPPAAPAGSALCSTPEQSRRAVVALDDVLVLSVLAARFHELRADHSELTEWLLMTLAQRLARMSDLLADALFLDAEHRVARRLLDCRCSFGTDGSETLPLTQDDLAAMAGVSRATANRVLRHLEDQGSVRLGRRHITISDLESLARAAR